MGLKQWFRKKVARPPDPLAAFDARIDALASRGSALRKSAAALMALRRDLERQLADLEAQSASLTRRIDEALLTDAQAAGVLQGDLATSRARHTERQAELTRISAEGEALAESLRKSDGELQQLRQERGAAKAQLASSAAVLGTSTAFTNPVDQMLELERAREEVERARALADIYREEAAAAAPDDPLAALDKHKPR